MAACDCYVSLHRSEGFGLTMAEAMAIGKPVIATGYSGNLDFMNAENSYLVDYELGRVGPDCEIYPPEGDVGASPSVEHAAELMREVHGRPRGRCASRRAPRRAHIAAEFSTEALARIAGARLDEIWAERDARQERRKARAEARKAKKQAEGVDGADQTPAELITSGLKKVRNTTARGLRAARRRPEPRFRATRSPSRVRFIPIAIDVVASWSRSGSTRLRSRRSLAWNRDVADEPCTTSGLRLRIRCSSASTNEIEVASGPAITLSHC